MSTNLTIRDDSIAHQAWMVRLYRTRAAGMVKALRAVERDILERIERTNPETFTRYHLEQMVTRVNDMVRELTAVGRAQLTQDVHDVVKRETAWLAGTVNRDIPVAVDVVGPHLTAVYSAVSSSPMSGQPIRDWWSDMDRGLRSAIDREIRIGHVEGQSPMQIARRLRGTRRAGYSDGVFGRVVHRRVEALVRTALSHAQHVAREEFYRENDDLIGGVQIVATLDNLTSLICMNYDGRVFPVDEGPRPPFHPNCRSTTVPVVKSWRELGFDRDELPEGTRASIDGQVPEATRFPQWIAAQSEERQLQVLGRARFDAWKAGKVALSDLTAESRVLTLAELNLDR